MYENIITIIAGLSGLGGFVSILVNILKWGGIAKDGTGQRWYQIISLVAFIGVAVTYIWQLDVDWGQVDDWLNVLALLAGYTMQIFTGHQAYALLEGAPLIGYRHPDGS